MNDQLLRLLFLVQLGTTLFMTGLIWFVQVVHYPLFAGVGGADFCRYEARHRVLTSWVVGPPMLFEAATAVLFAWYAPAQIPAWSIWTGLVLVGVIWASTALFQIPCHEMLSQSFDAAAQRKLVFTNWLRTIAWSARAGLLLWMTWTLIR